MNLHDAIFLFFAGAFGGGINAVALVSPGDVNNPVQALIPTGWYPSAVATSADASRVFVINRKSPPGPNPKGCAPELAIYRGQPTACDAANQYILQLEKAGLLEFPMPEEAEAYTVVINDEEQYSIWPQGREIPAGWREAGKSGTKEECLAYVDVLDSRVR